MSSKKIFFPNLDGWRTLAFASVFFGHTLTLFNGPDNHVAIKIFNRIIGNADLGVSFFFALSGFLITYLLLAEQQRNGNIHVRSFYVRRILRIWPVYFFVILIAILLSLISHPFFSLHRISFPLLMTFFTNLDTCYNGQVSSMPISVLWSVAVEEQFYLLLPLLIVIFGKKIFRIFPVFILLSLIFRLYYKDHIEFIAHHSLSVCGALFTGCYAAWLCFYKGLEEKIRRIPKIAIILFYILLTALTIGRGSVFTEGTGYAVGGLIFPILFTFVILEQNFCENSFYKMKQFKFLDSVGKYTYGLYAYHLIFVCLFAIALQKFYPAPHPYIIYLLISLLCLAVCYVFSVLSYKFMETKFLKYKDKFFNR